ncbi:MAG: hypothetical protein VX000_07000, partial [Myxococcota bacterium]|nr:hypothetical protein [Myxococcota bacterium]
RVHAGTMPAGGGPSEAQRDRLHTWFACGAPGTEARLSGVSDAVVRTGGSTVIVITSQSAVLAGGTDWAIRTGDIISGSATRTRVIETYDVDGADAWLWSRELWGPAGEALLQWSWDPPLPVGVAAQDTWSAASTVTLVDGDGVVEAWEQDWEFARGPADVVDGWSVDNAPLQILGLSQDGAEEGWLQSSVYGITGRWWLDGDGAGVIYQQALDQRVGAFSDDFPLVAGDRRGGRIVEWEVAP